MTDWKKVGDILDRMIDKRVGSVLFDSLSIPIRQENSLERFME